MFKFSCFCTGTYFLHLFKITHRLIYNISGKQNKTLKKYLNILILFEKIMVLHARLNTLDDQIPAFRGNDGPWVNPPGPPLSGGNETALFRGD